MTDQERMLLMAGAVVTMWAATLCVLTLLGCVKLYSEFVKEAKYREPRKGGRNEQGSADEAGSAG